MYARRATGDLLTHISLTPSRSLPYFYSHLARLFASDYTPTDADILHCRNKTSGIIETIFPLREHVYRIFDVGGQRSERKKCEQEACARS